MADKKLIAYINTENEVLANVINQASAYETSGADGIFLYNHTAEEKGQEEFLRLVKEVVKTIDIPVFAGCSITCFEDIKKAFYTGAYGVVLKYSALKDKSLILEASKRFGKQAVLIELDEGEERSDGFLNGNPEGQSLNQFLVESGAGTVILKHITLSERVIEAIAKSPLPVIIRDSLIRNDIESLLAIDNVYGVATNYYIGKDMIKTKKSLRLEGIKVNTFESGVDFKQLQPNPYGLIPVIVQDYKTNEVLMLAYMNEEAYEKTLLTGKMTYYSRSRRELWLKGETSGHFQYVKSLTADCDKDTLLAKVKQLGAACHTGNRSCFHQPLMTRDYKDINPHRVFDEVYQVILDRKVHPKEGSYTNYLFDQGIDKILKKCGEEAAEIIIAAKNPDTEEIKYEISDFLYHMMVLMAERGVDWDDIIGELSHRR